MPVNFLTHKNYSINYEELYNELMSNPFLDNIQIQSMYLKLWIQQLKEQDEIEVKQLKDDNFVQLMLKEDFEAPERYMLDINYKSGTINIFFRVSRMLQLIQSTNNTGVVQEIPIKDFTKTNSYIKWNRTEYSSRVKESPIVLIPMTIDKYIKLIVVDGNHRLTEWEKIGRQKIPCYIIDEQFIIDNNFLCSGFSKLMYIFQNEIVALGTYTKRDHINAMILMNKIFFKTGKILYNV